MNCIIFHIFIVQAIHGYVASGPDELTLEESDIINVITKNDDGINFYFFWRHDNMNML